MIFIPFADATNGPASVRHQGAVTEAAMSWQGKAPCDMPGRGPKSAGNVDVFEIGCSNDHE